jgi:glycosyltransferase involved in cell wall biosynthesis
MLQGGFGTGGAEKVMAQLAEHRAARGDDVHVAGMYMAAEGSFFPYPDTVRLHVLVPGARANKLLQIRRLFAIRRLIRQLQPDLIVAFLTKVNCLTLLATVGSAVPVVISERNNPRLQSDRFWRHLQSALMPRAAGIAMQTRSAMDDLPPRQRAPDRARVIPNPCRPVEFRSPVPTRACRFVAAGRLDQQKGFDLLIDAFATLPTELPLTLTIFGQGQEERALQRQILRRGMGDRITLAGNAPSPAAWMEAGDVVMVTSRFEGFCNVVAEATCSGLPIIAFDCPYGPSEMIRDRVNGLLIRNGDVAELADAMALLGTQPELRAQLGAAPDLVSEQLDPARILRLWDQLFDEVTAPDGPDPRDQIPANAAPS